MSVRTFTGNRVDPEALSQRLGGCQWNDVESASLALSVGTMASYVHAWRESKRHTCEVRASGTLTYASLYLATEATLASLMEGGSWTSVRSESATVVEANEIFLQS